MNILGIDTSCDDTSAAVVGNGRQVLSSIVNSQVSIHHPYGGVVPELASREHVGSISSVVDRALQQATLSIEDLDAIAVTIGPGLVGALLVGLYYAKGICFSKRIPLIGVNHLEGHILSVFLEKEVPTFPFVVLTVSGGHTSLFHVKDFGNYELLGQTLDDAAGEAFDKVAKILGLGYPGGPIIEELARSGSEDKVHFPRAYLEQGSLDFSFSGLKTSVALFVKEWRQSNKQHTTIKVADIAASFQSAVFDVLVQKIVEASTRLGVSCAALVGGVACNRALRECVKQATLEKGIRLYCPRPQYCTDNAAMIAVAGFHRLLNGEKADLSIDVRSKFPVENMVGAKRNR